MTAPKMKHLFFKMYVSRLFLTLRLNDSGYKMIVKCYISPFPPKKRLLSECYVPDLGCFNLVSTEQH